MYKLFCVFFSWLVLGREGLWLCVYFMTGIPAGSTESDFMEKLGSEPATPGLQDIGLSHTPRRLHLEIMHQ